MSIKLLPASVDLVDSSQALDATSLVPLSQRAITTRGGQISPVPSGDNFARSSSTRRGTPNRIYGTFVEDSPSAGDSQSDKRGRLDGEYLSAGWAWSHSVSVVAHYLFYAANPTSQTGWLINLYA